MQNVIENSDKLADLFDLKHEMLTSNDVLTPITIAFGCDTNATDRKNSTKGSVVT